MRYLQYRLAKRNGEIVQQRRTVTTKPITHEYSLLKFWQVNKLGCYTAESEYGEWEDIPFPEIGSK